MGNQPWECSPVIQNNAQHNARGRGSHREHAFPNTWDRSRGRKSGRITRSVLLAIAYIAVWTELVVGSLSLTIREHQIRTSLGISGRPCQRDTDCPEEQVCATSDDWSNFTQGVSWCVCPRGYVLWKWSCHPKVLQLGGSCIFSAQCEAPYRHHHRICDPLSKQCACEFGFVPSSDGETCIMVNPAETTSTPEANLKMKLIRQIREDLETRNHTQFKDDVVSSGEDALHPKHLNSDQIHTVLYIGLALFCVLCVGAISALYMKFMKKKQNNQAAIRGLLDLVSGSDTNSVIGGGSSPGSFDSNTGGIYPHSYIIQPPTLGNGHIQCVDSSIINLDTSRRRQSKILLPALEEDQVVTYPAPHLSMPILPPIRNKPREHKGEDIRFIVPRPRVDGEIETPTIAAITESLNEINNRKSTYQRIMTESAASFPVVDSPPPIPEEPHL